MDELIEALRDIAYNRGNICGNRMLCAERAQKALRTGLNSGHEVPRSKPATGPQLTIKGE